MARSRLMPKYMCVCTCVRMYLGMFLASRAGAHSSCFTVTCLNCPTLALGVSEDTVEKVALHMRLVDD